MNAGKLDFLVVDRNSVTGRKKKRGFPGLSGVSCEKRDPEERGTTES